MNEPSAHWHAVWSERADALATRFAPAFDLVGTADEQHLTPWHSTQHFPYSTLRRR